MKVTFVGHAGLFIETAGGSILCDPWFNPAYFASWFPFPSNEDLDIEATASLDYLYVSHLHQNDARPRDFDAVRAFGPYDAHLFPLRRPPCFLDEELFGFTDLDGDPANPFPDQTVCSSTSWPGGPHQRPLWSCPAPWSPWQARSARSSSPPPRPSSWPRSATSGSTCRSTRPAGAR